MKPVKNQSETLLLITNLLPPFCQGFYLERVGERSLLTRIGYARDAYAFLTWLRERKGYTEEVWELPLSAFEEVRTVDIDAYLLFYRETHSDSATSRARCSLSNLFRYLQTSVELIPKNPVAGAGKVRREKSDFVTYLTLEEQNKLLQVVSSGEGLTKRQSSFHKQLATRNLALLVLILDTGMRVSEVSFLDWEDLDFPTCSLIIRRKGGKLQKLFYSSECREYLESYGYRRTESQRKGPFFLSLQGNRLSIREIQKLTECYTKLAFPEKTVSISPHKLRSSFAMAFYGETGNILALQKKMGHESLVSTNVYAKASEQEQQALHNWRTTPYSTS